MKKMMLLLFSWVVTIYGLKAQQIISFESAEGFTLGNINGQNGWISLGDVNGELLTSQVISDEQAVNGSQSFKITTDPAVSQQAGSPIGGSYLFTSPIDHTNATFSFDVYIDEVPGGNDYSFSAVGEDTFGTLFNVFLVNFSFDNNIRVLNDAAIFTSIATWTTDTWYNISIEITGGTAEYFVNDVSLASYSPASQFDIVSISFTHDNYGGSAYLDNFMTNDQSLSTVDSNVSNFEYFVDAQNNLNLSYSGKIENTSICSLTGQQVLSRKFYVQDCKINLETLKRGVYLVAVQIDGLYKAFKITKK